MERTALYAGSFDPITNGHLDLIKRASKMYDKLVVGVIVNQSKKATFTLEERKLMIAKATENLPNVSVDSFDGLLADYVNANNIDVLVRGLRATMDFEYELQMAHMNAHLFCSANNHVETIFLMSSPNYSFISSSIVKEVYDLKGDIYGLVPDVVIEMMDKKYKNK